MRILLALILGIIIGAGVLWYYYGGQGQARMRTTGEQIENATRPARDAIQQKLRELNLRPDEIRDELARSGQVVRRKAQEAGHAIADATADARITAAIKAKLVRDRDLSALTISVNTTGGVVTLSGSVPTPEDVSQAMLVAMDTEGVREVISTLQVKAKNSPG